MTLALMLLGVPLVIYGSLVLLPQGRPALIGLVAAALAVGLLGPRVMPEDGAGFRPLVLLLFGAPVAMAALAQGLRLLRGPDGVGPPYRLTVVAIFLCTAVPVAFYLGLI
ncbi:MAG: hypothetical protein ACK4L4_07165 [Gemmobacter sp.]